MDCGMPGLGGAWGVALQGGGHGQRRHPHAEPLIELPQRERNSKHVYDYEAQNSETHETTYGVLII